MKNLLFLLLLLVGFAEAQTVNIPDSNFKTILLSANSSNSIAKNLIGNFTVVDTNSNGEIEVSEALNINYIDVSQSNISDLTGIESFTNLEQLICDNNQITSLDLTSNIDLLHFNCSFNQILSINIQGLTNLEDIQCNNNQISNLDIEMLANLESLFCSNNQIFSLNLSNLTNLKAVDCSFNQLTAIDFSNCMLLINVEINNNLINGPLNLENRVDLESLNINENNFSSINLTNCSSLNYFSNNNLSQLTSLNLSNCNSLSELVIQNSTLLNNLIVTGCTNLIFLEINNTLIQSLDLYGLTNLGNLALFSTNALTSINLNGCINLGVLFISANNLTALDVSSCPNLFNIDIDNCPIAEFDASYCKNLQTLLLSSLTSLTSVNIKNGTSENLNFSGCTNLTYVCADETQIEAVLIELNNSGLSNTVCNSYCSFSPGGNYNTINGTVSFDDDNNGCENSITNRSYTRVNIVSNGITSSSFTNSLGQYTHYAWIGNYTITPVIENPLYFVSSPLSSTVSFTNTQNNTSTNDFCIDFAEPLTDLEVVIAPNSPARPGFNASYKVVYKNKSNLPRTGQISLNYDDSRLDLINSTLAISSQNNGILIFDYSDLLPLESRSFIVVFNLNSPEEIPSVNNGDQLDYVVSITPIDIDILPDDNTLAIKQTVVGSYDPNDITCLEGQTVSPSEIGEYLHYMVNFENTGNYYAENVVVKIEIDETKYDINSLQLLNTSHENKSKITNNIVEFIFEDINLVAASGNPPVGGHGNVLFKIKSKDNLVSGDMVQKAAKIYFDYNAPIETNISQTTYQSLTNPIFEFDESVKIYPNPTNEIININSNFNIKSIELYDIQGRILEKSFENNTNTSLNLSNRQSGIYFVKITSEKGSKVEKVVKN
jgi:Leucine-rich repeat (LRR) protein